MTILFDATNIFLNPIYNLRPVEDMLNFRKKKNTLDGSLDVNGSLDGSGE